MSRSLRRRLGRTNIDVFPINLGGNVFGWTADRAASFAVLDAYYEAGGNFIDTADVYSKWAPGHVGGESELVIGEWLKARGIRNQIIVATKVGMGGPDLAEGLAADQVRRGCEGSLRRLGVEQIDLFYAHQDDSKTPVEETVRAFDALVKEGKVRVLGASNFTPARMTKSFEVAEQNGLASYEVIQPEYNLVARSVLEGELAGLATSRGLAVCTYFALAAGFLTGKYRRGEKPTGARAQRVGRYIDDPKALDRLETLRAVAEKYDATPTQIALAWQLHKPFVTTPIASATSAEQVKELVRAVEIHLEAADLAKLDV